MVVRCVIAFVPIKQPRSRAATSATVGLRQGSEEEKRVCACVGLCCQRETGSVRCKAVRFEEARL